MRVIKHPGHTYGGFGSVLLEPGYDITPAATHLTSSSAVVFAATEHLASASGIVVVASKIGGAAFASASMVSSSVVA
jgi:hypothetical protein